MLKGSEGLLYQHVSEPTPEDSRFPVVICIAPFALLIHILLIPLFYYVGLEGLAWFNLISVGMWVAGIWLGFHGYVDLSLQLFTSEILAHSVFVTLSIGPDLGFQYYLWGIAAITVMDTSQSAWRVNSSSLMLILIFAVLNSGLITPWNPSPLSELQPYLKMLNILVAGMLSIIALIMLRQIFLNQKTELIKQATSDSLTGLYNRRQGLVLLDQSCWLSAREKSPLTIVMMDVDYFKRINDQYGHKAGDQVLCEIAVQLRGGIRKSDSVIRWGGEEFLMLFPNTTAEATTIFLEKVRQRVARIDLPDPDSLKHITLSFGVAQWQRDETIDRLISRADDALYQSKKKGRDAISIASTEREEDVSL